MAEKKQISYANWINLVKSVRKKGVASDEFRELTTSSPLLQGNDYDNFIYNELAILETELIRHITDDFQKSVNNCMEDRDLFIYEKGLKEFKNRIEAGLFFNTIEAFSEEKKRMLKKEIELKLLLFLESFQKYIKSLSEFEADHFIGEIIYLYKKANLKKFVLEKTSYE
ncbi:MAG: hypothetical protein IKP88_12575 [Lachnospiraceae bacterium]|nr:hypothetical protein [Lachnospiraceae bacterium]